MNTLAPDCFYLSSCKDDMIDYFEGVPYVAVKESVLC